MFNTFYYACCLLRSLVMKHVRQRKTRATQAIKNTGFTGAGESYFQKGTTN